MNISVRQITPAKVAKSQSLPSVTKPQAPVDSFVASSPSLNIPTRSQIHAVLDARAAFQPLPETPGDVEGPYYRDNAPVRANLFPEGEQGAPVKYSIEVVDTSGRAIPGANVDIWTADSKGEYDMTSQAFRGRAQGQASDEGKISFSGIRPGNYDLGTDPDTGQRIFRPAHVHGKFSAPGYKSVTGQLYFPDDPYNESDPIIDREEGERGFDPALVMQGENNDFSYKFVLGRA